MAEGPDKSQAPHDTVAGLSRTHSEAMMSIAWKPLRWALSRRLAFVLLCITAGQSQLFGQPSGQNRVVLYASVGAELTYYDLDVDPSNVRMGQAAGTLHVHPSGKSVYVANRASGTADVQGKPVFVGGETRLPSTQSISRLASQR
jgi:hypothetical protein